MLIQNLGYIEFHWLNVMRLWPLILLFSGLNMLAYSQSKRLRLVLRTTLLLLFLGASTYMGMQKNQCSNCTWKMEHYFRTISGTVL